MTGRNESRAVHVTLGQTLKSITGCRVFTGNICFFVLSGMSLGREKALYCPEEGKRVDWLIQFPAFFFPF